VQRLRAEKADYEARINDRVKTERDTRVAVRDAREASIKRQRARYQASPPKLSWTTTAPKARFVIAK
jgi:hypothetical protein